MSDRKKKVRSIIYGQIPTIRWKFGENRSGGSWGNLSQRCILKRRKWRKQNIQGGPKKWGHYVWRLKSLHAHIFKMPEQISVIFGLLQRRYILNASVDSIFIKFIIHVRAFWRCMSRGPAGMPRVLVCEEGWWLWLMSCRCHQYVEVTHRTWSLRRWDTSRPLDVSYPTTYIVVVISYIINYQTS